jgi:hypothetical protein
MNPFFEQCWRDAHTRLITYVCDALQLQLPPDLVARTEEHAVIGRVDGRPAEFRPDVQVRQPWELKDSAPAGAEVQDQPLYVFVDEETERWIEVRDGSGRLITVIELLSSTNKCELEGRDQYQRKRQGFISSGVNVVEIDLVRQGGSVFPKEVRDVLLGGRACYGICVFRASRPAEREVYAIRLQDRLPAIGIPLRASEKDAVLALQPLIDQCHEHGRYHRLDYNCARLDPAPAAEEAAWLDQMLRAAAPN